MSSGELFNIKVEKQTKSGILEEIIKYIHSPQQFIHIVSLNPENLIVASNDKLFKRVIETAQIKIIDGIGVVLAAHILNVPIGDRLTGVDLMGDLVELAEKMRLRVLLIGGKHDLALRLAECYNRQYPKARFFGTMGFSDIKNPTKAEEDAIFSIVAVKKPHMILAAFGSPWQELWLARHSRQFKGIIGMGVGQGFDVYGGTIRRAPRWIQEIGFEWLYRLLTQPWRWRRQIRLITFIMLVLKQKLFGVIDRN